MQISDTGITKTIYEAMLGLQQNLSGKPKLCIASSQSLECVTPLCIWHLPIDTISKRVLAEACVQRVLGSSLQ